ncbi:hypothetical protein [Saccharibacillus sacchari]|uniref:hypothetical protein n=1 Tax=Saccharibacillus sacchari TaxID=456493 RepID=UPI00056AB2CD|nr:hypothetical protein [Saccharibacillus sacchari]
MATKSFTSEFKFNQRASSKLADAIDNSRKVSQVSNQTVNDVVRTEAIQKIMDSFLSNTSK